MKESKSEKFIHHLNKIVDILAYSLIPTVIAEMYIETITDLSKQEREKLLEIIDEYSKDSYIKK